LKIVRVFLNVGLAAVQTFQK